MIAQSGLPPYPMTCAECGQSWEPPPARGQTAPTEASLDAAAARHWKTCRKEPLT